MTSDEQLRLSDCTMWNVPNLREELLGWLLGGGTVVVDRSGVQRPNTAMLQLLAAFAQELKAQSRAIEWRGSSEAFDRAARCLGLSEGLGLPAPAAGQTAGG
jgi:anti-anti-sigma regulatory factor